LELGARDLLLAVEHAAVLAWPALESADVDGWLWRYSAGGSLRANSAATLVFTGSDCMAAILRVEEFYRAKSAPSRFTISDVSLPEGLDRHLEARGYARGDPHVTLVKPVAPVSLPAEVEFAQAPSRPWLEVYLGGLSESRRGVAPRILARLPPNRTFIACRRAREVISSGLSVWENRSGHALASVQCMATRPAARRQGGALAVLNAIEARAHREGASHLYLQAEAANAAALALYTKAGFRLAGTYHVRFEP
jgi:ribosomal protein S18 acetylase RimI-like enzyme